MVDALVSLDDPAALDASVAGVKAARLAGARRAGYPVLPGLVVPRHQGERALEAGRIAVEAGRPAAARSAARGEALPLNLVHALPSVTRLGSRLVVRSSTRLDDDPRWAGTFASYGDVAADEVPTAIRGCWASVFAPDVLSRLRQTGRSAAEIGLAALIQPQVRPDLSGAAEMSDQAVEISAIPGPPAPLLTGWESGMRLTIGPAGDLDGASLSAPEVAALRQVAELVRALRSDFGAHRVEWAFAEGRVVILQLSDGDGAVPMPQSEAIPDVEGLVAYQRLASLLMRRRGPLADRFVAPWAGAATGDFAAPNGAAYAASGEAEPAELWAVASRLAAELSAVVAATTGVDPANLNDRLAQGDRELGVRLARVSLDPARWNGLLTACGSLAERLTAQGMLRAPEELWWQSPAWVAGAVSGGTVAASQRPAFDRFTPLLVGVTKAVGERRKAIPASPGLAAGRAIRVGRPTDGAALAPGDVLVVDAALPAYAPLLWTASAVIARRGSPAAHLCEVARALRRPAVVTADADWLPAAGGSTVGLDGASGDLWVSDVDRDLEPG